jgi:archaellum component FlaG (FlaF/FlaG flagellin family)
VEDCVSDPEFNATMCGFHSFPGCTPLNGCGSTAIYPFMLTFQLFIGYVFLNLFIGVILDGKRETKAEIASDAMPKSGWMIRPGNIMPSHQGL